MTPHPSHEVVSSKNDSLTRHYCTRCARIDHELNTPCPEEKP